MPACAALCPPGTDFPANGIFVRDRGAVVTAPTARHRRRLDRDREKGLSVQGRTSTSGVAESIREGGPKINL